MWDLAFMALAGAAGGVLQIWFDRHRRRLQFWQDVAASCGLSEVESYSVWNLQLALAAQAGLTGVWITHSGRGTWAGVRVPGPPGFKELKISREPTNLASREIEVGDEPFDRTFFVEGPVRLTRALLDAETRRLFLGLNAEGDLALVNEHLRAETSDAQLPRLLPLLLDLGRRFAQPLDVVRRLTENALCDPQAGVRLRNLLLLVRQVPGDPRTLETLRAARSDASPEIRLRAAMALGGEGPTS